MTGLFSLRQLGKRGIKKVLRGVDKRTMLETQLRAVDAADSETKRIVMITIPNVCATAVSTQYRRQEVAISASGGKLSFDDLL